MTSRPGITTLLVIFSFCQVAAQSNKPYSPQDIASNTVKSMSGFYQASDSIRRGPALITREYFNTAGRRTKIEIYDSDTITGYYEYVYRADTIPTERHSYQKGKLHSTTKWRYNDKGQVYTIVDYQPDGWKTGWESHYKYNKKGRRRFEKLLYQGRTVTHTKTKYHKNGVIKKLKVLAPKSSRRTLRYDIQGNLKRGQYGFWKEVIDPKDEHKEHYIKRTTSIIASDRKILGLGGEMRINKGDKHVTDHYIGRNCLLDHSKEYLNGKHIGSKYYELTYY